jgi:cytochrome c biogenesis protein CcmG, thiol:disulfide interchange protein DsbE
VTGPNTTEGPSRRWDHRIIGPFTVGHLVIAAIVLVVAAALLVVLGTPLGTEDGPSAQVPGSGFYQVDDPTTGLAIGQIAPELEGNVDGQVVGLRDLDGAPLRLADLRGEPVWLSFFATWCPPCQEETPVLRDAWERYGLRGLQMIAVSVQETTPDDVADWARTYDLRYPIGFDATSAVFHAYQGFGLPTHVFIDRDGIIRHLQYGPLDREQVAAIVEPLLAMEATSTPDAASAGPMAGASPAAETVDPLSTPLH